MSHQDIPHPFQRTHDRRHKFRISAQDQLPSQLHDQNHRQRPRSHQATIQRSDTNPKTQCQHQQQSGTRRITASNHLINTATTTQPHDDSAAAVTSQLAKTISTATHPSQASIRHLTRERSFRKLVKTAILIANPQYIALQH